MKYSSILLLLILCLALVSCSNDSSTDPVAPTLSAGDADKDGMMVPRPFRGTWVTAISPPADPIPGCDGDPTTGPFEIAGWGRATHMGNTTYNSVSESDFINQCGSGSITAANGDQLFVEFGGDVDASQLPFVTFSGDFTFTGGTGRFAGASGSGTYSGSASVAESAGEVTYDGMITY